MVNYIGLMMEENKNLSYDVQIAVVNTKLEGIASSIAEIKALYLSSRNDYVLKDQLKEQLSPLKAIVYGQVALIVTAFISGLVLLVWKT